MKIFTRLGMPTSALPALMLLSNTQKVFISKQELRHTEKILPSLTASARVEEGFYASSCLARNGRPMSKIATAFEHERNERNSSQLSPFEHVRRHAAHRIHSLGAGGMDAHAILDHTFEYRACFRSSMTPP